MWTAQGMDAGVEHLSLVTLNIHCGVSRGGAGSSISVR